MKPMKPINLCIIKRITSDIPYVFEDVAACVRESLGGLGFTTFLTVNKILPEADNIVFGAGAPGGPTVTELRALTPPENTLIFNLEQLGSGSPWDNEAYYQLLADYRVLDYNHHNVAFMRARQPRYRGVEFPVYPSESFRSGFAYPALRGRPAFDACFYGGVNARREAILSRLEADGLKIKRINGFFGPHLAEQLTDSRCVLNIHHYETAILETTRLLRPVMMGIPVISETSVMPRTVRWDGHGVQFLAEFTAEQIRRVIDNPDRIRRLVEGALSYFSASDRTEKTFLALELMRAGGG